MIGIMQNLINEYKKLPKEIYILGVATLINRMGDFVIPFVTLYLNEKLGIPLYQTGIVVAILGLTRAPGSYFGGKLSDHWGSKNVFVICQLTAAFILLIPVFVSNPMVVVISLILFSLVAAMVRTPTQTMISDLLPPELRRLGFTVRYIGINIGVAIGLAVAGLLYKYNTTLLFIGDSATMILSILLIIIFIDGNKLKEVRVKNIGDREGAETGHIFTVLLRRKGLVLYMVLSSILLIGFYQTHFALPLTTQEQFGVDGSVIFGFLISINAITATIIALFYESISKRFRVLDQIIVGGVLFALGFGLYSVTSTKLSFILATILWSIGEVMIFTNSSVFVLNNSPENFRGRLAGTYTICLGLAGSLGILVTERLIEFTNLSQAWFILGFITLVTVVLLIILKQIYFIKK